MCTIHARIERNGLPQEPDNTTGQDPHAKHFATEHLKADLKGRSVRSGLVTLISASAGLVLGMGSFAVLGRLLNPSDYGLIGMVSVIIGFVVLFKDMGLSMATVQQEKINHQQVSTLFWINMFISCVTASITVILAPFIAWFYGEPLLLYITLATAPGQIVSALIIQHQALLRRQMKFGTLAAIDITSQIASISLAIFMAYKGCGYWSLIAQTLACQTTNMLLVWSVTRWNPSRPVRNSGVRPML